MLTGGGCSQQSTTKTPSVYLLQTPQLLPPLLVFLFPKDGKTRGEMKEK